jgi:hypothetical protein
MEVISSPQARPPIGTRAPAPRAGWENCVRMPGPLQLLILHLLALLFARSPHAAGRPGTLAVSPRLRQALIALLLDLGLAETDEEEEYDDSDFLPLRCPGAIQILIALAHRLPPRDPARPARMPPARPRRARGPPARPNAKTAERGQTPLRRRMPNSLRYRNYLRSAARHRTAESPSAPP